jgi:hypothetical protein
MAEKETAPPPGCAPGAEKQIIGLRSQDRWATASVRDGWLKHNGDGGGD